MYVCSGSRGGRKGGGAFCGGEGVYFARREGVYVTDGDWRGTDGDGGGREEERGYMHVQHSSRDIHSPLSPSATLLPRHTLSSLSFLNTPPATFTLLSLLQQHSSLPRNTPPPLAPLQPLSTDHFPS